MARARVRDVGDHLAIKKLMRGPLNSKSPAARCTVRVTKTAATGSDNLANCVFL